MSKMAFVNDDPALREASREAMACEGHTRRHEPGGRGVDERPSRDSYSSARIPLDALSIRAK
jgi:hypothetical protein